MKIPKVEIPESGWASRLMNNIIWGDSHFNPNKEIVTPNEVDIDPRELSYDSTLPKGIKSEQPY